MATTSDLAPTRRRVKAAADDIVDTIDTEVSGAAADAEAETLEDQVSQLQDDLRSIASTLARLTSDKVSEARSIAKGEVRNLQRQGGDLVADVQDRAYDLEDQLKQTIREKPLTAVASAIGIGYLLALLTRH